MKTIICRHSIAGALAALALLPAASYAAIIVSAPTDTTPGSFLVTDDITFNILTNSSGMELFFALDEWVTSDGSMTIPTFSPSLSISFNGNAPASYLGGFIDNATFTSGGITPNDGLFYAASTPSVAPGDTVTVKAGTYTLAPASGFNPQATQTFTGNMFVTNGIGTRFSNTVAVTPEPSAALLASVGTLALGFRRRARKA